MHKMIADSTEKDPTVGRINYLWENEEGHYALYSEYEGKYLRLTKSNLQKCFGSTKGLALWKQTKHIV